MFPLSCIATTKERDYGARAFVVVLMHGNVDCYIHYLFPPRALFFLVLLLAKFIFQSIVYVKTLFLPPHPTRSR